MVHKNKFVAVIKVAGKVLRESKDNTVFLPFGAEYSVLIKNLDSRKIKFKLSVDGKDATEGTWLIVHPNDSLELERYIRAGNLTNGNRFKFIERTEAIEEHRGVQAEDGLLRIEWLTERAVKEVPRLKYFDVPVPIERSYYPERPYYPPWPWGPRPYLGAQRMAPSARLMKCAVQGDDAGHADVGHAMNFSDAGITVPGSESHQQFHHVPDFACETESEVVVIKLRGQIGGAPVQQAVTVKHKPKCETCGRTNQGGSAFCSQCGTTLNLI